MSGNGLSIENNGHITRLKWHRLRRALTDPVFGFETLARGFELGASMELDLQIRNDGGFVVLHDDTLDRESSGNGDIRSKTAVDLAGLSYLQSGAPLLLSEHLAGMLHVAHPNALLQFDMKNDLAEVGPEGVDHLASLFADKSDHLIVSGGSTDLIVAIGDRLSGIRRGIDPTDRLVDVWRDRGLTAVEEALREEANGPAEPDMIYLAWELLLKASDAGLDLVALCHADDVRVDAWTYTLARPSAGFSAGEWQEFSALMALGPDQITTDEAVAIEAAWQARAGGARR